MSFAQPLAEAGKTALSAVRAASGASSRIVAAVEKAAASTGVDFAYLLEKAAAESGFDASAKAKTSSATGLYQFIESTWLEMVEKHGAKYGLAREANALAAGAAGGAEKARILSLRNNPELSASLAAEFTRENRTHLEDTVGGTVGNTELYLAHFLGAGGAEKFLKAHNANPDRPAAMLMPEAAAANRAVFFDAGGRMRSVGEIYDRFAKRFDDDATPAKPQAAATLTAQAPAPRPIDPQPAVSAFGTGIDEDPLPLLKPLRLGPPSSGVPIMSGAGVPRGIALSPVTMLAMAELSPGEPLPRTAGGTRRSEADERQGEADRRWSESLWRSRGLN